MRLVALWTRHRFRQNLLMQFDSSHNAVSPSNLKRPFARQATANVANKPTSGEYPTQVKFPKLEEASPPSREGFPSKDAQLPHRPPRTPQSPGFPLIRTPKGQALRTPRSATIGRLQSKGKSKLGPSAASSNATLLELPVRDHEFIVHQHESNSRHLPSIKPVYEENPKSPLSNFCNVVLGRSPEYHSVLGVYPDRPEKIWR